MKTIQLQDRDEYLVLTRLEVQALHKFLEGGYGLSIREQSALNRVRNKVRNDTFLVIEADAKLPLP